MWETAWTWLKSAASFLYSDLLTTLLDNVPDSWQVTVSDDIRPILNFVELWVPLSFALTLAIAWFTFLIAFIVLKMVLKLCPFIG